MKEAHWPVATVGAPRQHSEKSLEIKAYPDVGFYKEKPEITGKQQSKTPKNAKNNLLKTKKVLTIEIYEKWGLSF